MLSVSTATETTTANPTVEETNATSQLSSGTEVIETSSIKELPPAIFTEDSVAIRGADPVDYFTKNRYVPGSADFACKWADATWQFASAENRDVFALNPEQYAPQYGGFCAWAASEGYTALVDPNAWEIVDGKLYLNFSVRHFAHSNINGCQLDIATGKVHSKARMHPRFAI